MKLDFVGIGKEHKFDILTRLAEACAVFPHSSADIE